MAYGQFPYGLNQLKVSNGVTAVALDAAQELTFSVRVRTAELPGNDTIVKSSSIPDAVEWTLSEGGIPLAALAIMTGWTATESGSTPNRNTTMKGHAGVAYPEFIIYGKALGDSGDDTHLKLYRCKITGAIEGSFKGGEFWVTKCTGSAVEHATNGLFDIVRNETAATLPSL